MKCMFFFREFIDNYFKNDKFLFLKFIFLDWGVLVLRNFYFKNVGFLVWKDLKCIFNRWFFVCLILMDK